MSKVLDWDMAKEFAVLLEVVKEDCRRESLMMLLKYEGFKLSRTVPSDVLFNLNKLSEFIRLYSKNVDEIK